MVEEKGSLFLYIPGVDAWVTPKKLDTTQQSKS